MHPGEPQQCRAVVALVEGAAEQCFGLVEVTQARKAVASPAEDLLVCTIGQEHLVPVGSRLLVTAQPTQGVGQPEDPMNIVGVLPEHLLKMVLCPREIELLSALVPGHGADVQEARIQLQQALPAGQRRLGSAFLLMQVPQPGQGIAILRIMPEGRLIVIRGALGQAQLAAGIADAGLNRTLLGSESQEAVPGLQAAPPIAHAAVGIGQPFQGLEVMGFQSKGREVEVHSRLEMPCLAARSTGLDEVMQVHGGAVLGSRVESLPQARV